MESTRIFSDLHLGHPASTVGGVRALFPLFDGFGRLCFNGDTVETCSHELSAHSLGLLAKMEEGIRAAGSAGIFQPGNHDPDRSGPGYSIHEDGELVVTHGDICFRYGSPWSPWVPKIMDRLNAAERHHGGWENLLDLDTRSALARDYARAFQPRPRRFTGFKGKLETIFHAAWPPSTALRILDVWINGPDHVAGWMETYLPSAKVLVMGHTHRPGCWLRRGRWIVNTGAFHPFTTPHVVDHRKGHLMIRPLRRISGSWRADKPRVTLVREDSGWVRA